MADSSIVLIGASGRMGREIIAAAFRVNAEENRSIQIVGGLVGEGDAALGELPEGVHYPFSAEWRPEYREADVLIDFSSPGGAIIALEIAKREKLPLLSATTGLPSSYDAALKEAAQEIPIVRATNTSICVNVMNQLVSLATQLLGSSVDIEIVEAHHKRKKDAPSGTAITLLETVCKAQEGSGGNILHGRSPETGERQKGEIGMHAIRGGDIPGEHTVYFIGENERLEITQRAISRSVFATGALRAATWLTNQSTPGLYSMNDVL